MFILLDILKWINAFITSNFGETTTVNIYFLAHSKKKYYDVLGPCWFLGDLVMKP